MVDFIEYADRARWAAAIAERVAARLEAAARTRGDAGLVVSGGATPEPMFRCLAAEGVDWRRVAVTLADERWVPLDHPDRNEGIVRRGLLTGDGAAARLIGPGSGVGDPASAALAWEAALPPASRGWDVTLLGMGDDGHTASWFPGGDTLAQALAPDGARRCLSLNAPGAKHARVTLTLPEIIRTGVIMVLIVGAAKREVYRRLWDDGPAADMPTRAVLRQTAAPVEVHWAP